MLAQAGARLVAHPLRRCRFILLRRQHAIAAACDHPLPMFACAGWSAPPWPMLCAAAAHYVSPLTCEHVTARCSFGARSQAEGSFWTSMASSSPAGNSTPSHESVWHHLAVPCCASDGAPSAPRPATSKTVGMSPRTLSVCEGSCPPSKIGDGGEMGTQLLYKTRAPRNQQLSTGRGGGVMSFA